MWMPLVALAALLGAAEPIPHPGVADPMAFVAERYRLYQRGERGNEGLADYASARLRVHLDGFDSAMGGQEPDSLDAWIDDADDWALSRVALTLEPSRNRSRQTITVRFLNEGRPLRLVFHFVRERDSWYLDELSKPGRGGWTLTQRLGIRPGTARRLP